MKHIIYSDSVIHIKHPRETLKEHFILSLSAISGHNLMRELRGELYKDKATQNAATNK
jgi:hypothetical protein